MKKKETHLERNQLLRNKRAWLFVSFISMSCKSKKKKKKGATSHHRRQLYDEAGRFRDSVVVVPSTARWRGGGMPAIFLCYLLHRESQKHLPAGLPEAMEEGPKFQPKGEKGRKQGSQQLFSEDKPSEFDQFNTNQRVASNEFSFTDSVSQQEFFFSLANLSADCARHFLFLTCSWHISTCCCGRTRPLLFCFVVGPPRKTTTLLVYWTMVWYWSSKGKNHHDLLVFYWHHFHASFGPSSGYWIIGLSKDHSTVLNWLSFLCWDFRNDDKGEKKRKVRHRRHFIIDADSSQQLSR